LDNSIENERNRGPAEARNQAIELSNGDFLWFLDSDTIVPDDRCLSFMVSAMLENEKFGAIGGELIRGSDGRKAMLDKKILLNGDTDTFFIEPESCLMRETGYLSTCNCMIRTGLMKKIGGFDPEYFFLGEDVEVGYMIRKNGYSNIMDFRSAVIHVMHPKSRMNSFYLNCRNNIRFAVKNYPAHIIPALPLLDIFYAFTSNKISMVRSHSEMIKKYLPETGEGKAVGGPMFLIKTAIRYLAGLFGGYIWNAVNLPRTLKSRRTERNYLVNCGADERR